MRVLLVEDEKELAGALRAALSHHRMVADHARDLTEAALILNDAVYDVVVLDNLSGLPPWLSDALCRLSTGGGFATRELYTDTDEVLLDYQRPCIITGIEDLATRGDLLDRAHILTLPEINQKRRRPEGELWAAFAAAQPELMRAASKGVVHANTASRKVSRLAQRVKALTV